MSEDIVIYEPIYRVNQKLANPAFYPLLIHDNSSFQYRELKHLVDLYDSGAHLRSRFTGLFSPKFQLKAHITGNEFINFAHRNLLADVCFINPFPQIGYWSYNVWMQGDIAHPGLKQAAQNLLAAVEIPLDIQSTPRHGANFLAYSNFWVGTPGFWEGYVGGILKPIFTFIQKYPTNIAVKESMLDTRHTVAAPLLPFIIERLFSTYISTNIGIDARPYRYLESEIIEKYCLNDFERLLLIMMRNEINKADRDQNFSTRIINQMNSACNLFQQHHNDYYGNRKHPHNL